MYGLLRRFADAEAPRKRALAINERAYGNEHPNVAESRRGLGHLYRLQDRFEEALPLLQRGLSIAEKTLGADQPRLVMQLTEIGELHRTQGLYIAAEALLRRGAGQRRHVTGDAAELADTQRIQILQSHDFLLSVAGSPPGRTSVPGGCIDHERASVRCRSQPDRQFADDLGLSSSRPRSDGGSRAALRASPADQREGRAGRDCLHRQHRWPRVGAFQEKELGQGLRSYQAGFDHSHCRGSMGQRHRQCTSWLAGAVIPHAEVFLIQAATAFRLPQRCASRRCLARGGVSNSPACAELTTAAALGQMAARFSSGTSALANLVRERQDLSNEWRAHDARVTAEFSALPAQRNPEKEQALRSRLAAIADRLDTLDGRLAKEFPEYTSLARPAAAPRSRGLRNGSHLEMSWCSLPAGSSQFMGDHQGGCALGARAAWRGGLARELAALGCGLDTSAGRKLRARAANLYRPPHRGGHPLPFDLVAPRSIRGVACALSGLHERPVADRAFRPLTAVPFSEMVTEAPARRLPADVFRSSDVAWLAKRHASAVLPAVSSLASLKDVTQPAALRARSSASAIRCSRVLMAETAAPWQQRHAPKVGCARRRALPPYRKALRSFSGERWAMPKLYDGKAHCRRLLRSCVLWHVISELGKARSSWGREPRRRPSRRAANAASLRPTEFFILQRTGLWLARLKVSGSVPSRRCCSRLPTRRPRPMTGS